MILTIWRHGEADHATVDRFRELTATGREDILGGARQFLATCASRGLAAPTIILNSPWLRAEQTARLIAEILSPVELQMLEVLQPGSNVRAVDDMLHGIREQGSAAEHLVLVSHQPLVSQLVNHYLGASGTVPPLPPGGLVTLSCDFPAPGSALLRFWALPPEYEAVML